MKAIILAGGRGKRMGKDMPKCCQKVWDKPMILHIVSSLKKAGINDIIVVVGYKGELVKEILHDEVKYAYQKEQLGTANAALVGCCDVDDDVLITLGDMPFISSKTFNKMVKKYHEKRSDLLLATYVKDNEQNANYGRIIRENKTIKEIIEAKDCDDEQLKVKELNASLYVTNSKQLKKALVKVNNENNQHEYYLTDIVKIYNKEKLTIDSYEITNALEIQGINSLEELEKLEQLKTFLR